MRFSAVRSVPLILLRWHGTSGFTLAMEPDGALAAPPLAPCRRSRGFHLLCQAGRRANARKLRWDSYAIRTISINRYRLAAREKSMSHSPLENVILFHVGIVPISRTVVTTWGLMAALTVASWTRDAELSSRCPADGKR